MRSLVTSLVLLLLPAIGSAQSTTNYEEAPAECRNRWVASNQGYGIGTECVAVPENIEPWQKRLVVTELSYMGVGLVEVARYPFRCHWASAEHEYRLLECPSDKLSPLAGAKFERVEADEAKCEQYYVCKAGCTERAPKKMLLQLANCKPRQQN